MIFQDALKKYSIWAYFTLILLISCQADNANKVEISQNANDLERPLAKFEPSGDQVILFVGQEMEAIGGLDAPYNEGYLDHFKRPAGFTMYTNLSVGDESFGHTLRGLDGVFNTGDWGDEKSNMSLQLADDDFANMALAIGLWFVNHEEEVANGTMDPLIDQLGEFFKSLGERPVFLRIGYEFDGHSWNHYDRENYLLAYKRIKDLLDRQGVNNVAYVWQSTGWVSDQYQLEEWYPGDRYVDWCSVSFFNRWKEIEMFDFARKKGKPVFIAEASPTISDHMAKFTGNTKPLDLSIPEQAQEAWERWFTPFFKTIDNNKDVVKAISYINCYWKSHPMWLENPTFKRVDARLQLSQEVSDKWKAKVYTDQFIHSSEDLYALLWNREQAK